MVDIATFGETMLRLSPPRGERIETTATLDARVAGAESNVAVAAASLGADAVWLSKLPDSPLGRRVVRDLRHCGVEPAVAWSDDGRLGTYYIEQGGAPRGTNVVYDRAGAAVTTATPADVDDSYVADADVFYTSGITPALSPTVADTTRTLLSVAQDADTTTAFDVNYRSKLWSPEEARRELTDLFPLVDVLVCAARDASTVLGYDGAPADVATDLAADYDVETAIVTCGADGAVAVHAGEVHDQPAVDADTLDPVGTGDAFVGAFLARRIAGDDVASALAYGAATASMTRTVAGDMGAFSREEIERVLDGANRDLVR